MYIGIFSIHGVYGNGEHIAVVKLNNVISHWLSLRGMKSSFVSMVSPRLASLGQCCPILGYVSLFATALLIKQVPHLSMMCPS